MDPKLADLLVALDESLRGKSAAREQLPVIAEPGGTDEAELRDLVGCIETLHARWPGTKNDELARLDMAPRDAIAPPLLPTPGDEKPIVRIGRFEIQRVLGEGGFGIVYLATDPTLSRSIALKVPRTFAVAGTRTWERFRREAQAAATLDHANIVPMYEAGQEGAICYIASAYCEGPNLAQWLKEQNSPVCPRLAASLIARLADAAHYSHSRGILHRDLKPSNVMLSPQTSTTAFKSENQLPFIPRLTDFGLAKLVDEECDESAISALFGTPSYMAPEQAEGATAQVGPGTDVYALGAILYELLTGRPPFQGTNVVDVIDEVLHEDPVVPRRLRREIPRDLEVICLKCLEKRPGRRYATAGELSEDLQRFLNGDLVRARRSSAAYSAVKWMRRRPATTATMIVSAVALLIFLSGGWYYNRHLAHALQVAEGLRLESVDREEQLRLQMYAADMRLAWKAWEAGDTDETLVHLNSYLPRAEEKDLRGFEWHLLRASSTADVQSLRGHAAPILTADVSPDDAHIASGDRGGVIRIYKATTGEALRSWQYGEQEVTCVRFSPDGQTLATAGQDRTIRLWNVADWSETSCLQGHELTVTAIAWSPDSRQLASSGRDNLIKIWDVGGARGPETLVKQSDAVRTLAWSPDGQLLAAGVRDDGLRLWNTSTWQPLTSPPRVGSAGILALAFSPDSKRLASAGYGGNLFVHELSTNKALAEIDLINTIWSLRFSPDGGLLMAGRADGLVSLWEARSADGEFSELRTIQAGKGAVRDVAFDSEGRFVVMALEQDRVLQVRTASDLAVCRPYHFAPACCDMVDEATSSLLLDATGRMTFSSMAPDSRQLRPLQLTSINDAVFSPRGDLLATASVTTGVALYDAKSLALRTRKEAGEDVLSVSVSPNGQQLSGSAKSGAISLWDTDSRLPSCKLEGHISSTVHTAFSPDNKLLASASPEEQQIFLWDTTTGARVAEWRSSHGVTALAFSPDSKALAVAALDHIVMLYDVASPSTKPNVLRGHTEAVRAVAFSPDGQTIATAADDGTARLWHAATKQELCVLARRSRPFLWMRFLSPRQLAIGTASPKSAPLSSNDVIVFDTGELSLPGGEWVAAVKPEPPQRDSR